MSTATSRLTAVQPTGKPPAHRPRRQVAPWLMLSPAALVILIVTVAPIGFLVWASFTNFDQRSLFTGAFDMVGVQQYEQIFSNPDFWWSVVRTVWFTAFMVIGSLVIGAGVAQLLTKLGRGMRYVVTVVLIFAWAMPNVASSEVWNWLFEPGYGIVNWLLTKLHIFGDMTNTDWGVGANPAFLAVLCIWLLIVWQAVPFIALTLYAALTQLPAERVEAARIDGAGEWRIWFRITMPFLRPTLLLLTILSIIWDSNVFNQIWLISQGGPEDATSTLGIYAYKTAFVSFHVGTGAAVSVVTTILLLGVTATYIRNLLRSGEDL